jgi:hypothetical protein
MQCPLRLWYSCYRPELAASPTPAQQAIFDTGTLVGELARKAHPGGVLIDEDHLHHDEAVRSTEQALRNTNVPSLYEGAFTTDGVRIRADILKRSGNRAWDLLEVKSSTKVKDEHRYDLAIQYRVVRRSGLAIRHAGIVHLNRDYIYDGNNLDLNALFVYNDLRDMVVDMQAEVEAKLQELKSVLQKESPPKIKPWRQCFKPYDCEFYSHCKSAMPDNWVLQLSGIGQGKMDQLTQMGIDNIRDVPETFPLTELQTRIRQCVVGGTEHIGVALKRELSERQYPIHFLDFETINPAIPQYAKTRPYHLVPSQWSDHILTKGGSLDHKDYLSTDHLDPRREVARTLLETLCDTGDIVTYTNYEKTVISSLANDLPQDREELLALLDRCWDLCAAIRANYYHPEFHGSFSLKAILPVLVPSMSYKNLPIQEGEQAGLEYLRMIDPKTPPEEKETIRKNLTQYCGQDTLGMVQIREELVKRSGL